MSVRRHTLAVGLLATLIHHSGWAQTDAASVLLDQGKFWTAKGDTDRAGEAWKRLLLLEPNQPNALYGLAGIELKAQRTSGAQTYLTQLRAAHPESPLVAQLEQDIALRSGTRAKDLEKARVLAESGELDKAVVQYDAVLAGRTPQGPLALEYYNYLGYTSGGWQRARDGLERLSRQSPNDNQIKLSLAKLLTRNESTRAEGIARLQKLSQVPEVASDASESARMALTWLGTPRAAELPLFQAHLKANPNDEEIRAQMNSVGRERATRAQAQAGARGGANRTAGPRTDPTLARGLRSLEAGDSVAAENDFQARLRVNPDDGEALGGLGVIRMQQGRMADSETLLVRASQKNPAWRAALNNTRYWILVNKANAAQAAGDSTTARRLLDQAIKLDPKQSGAENQLANIEVDNNRLDAAEQLYRRVLARNKNDRDALRGLVGVLAQTNRAPEARRLIDQAPSSDAVYMSRLRAAYAAGVARAATARGDDAAARAALEDAMGSDPTNVWIRLDLARLYTKAGRNKDAQGLVDGLLASQPNSPDALYASAMLATELGQWNRALSLLDRIPAANRTPDIQGLQRRVWVNAQAASASELAKQGRRDEARALLANALPVAGDDVSLLGAIASSYVDAGDAPRGLSMVRQIVERTPNPKPDVLLQYASILLKTDQDVEASVILRELSARNMTAGEQQSYADLRRLYTIRQAEALRKRGDLVAAYDTLAPVLAERPSDPQAVGALARMYAAAGDNAKALDLHKQLLKNDPDNANLQLGAAQMANQVGDYRYAANAADTAVALAPDDPDILGGAGRVYRAQGKSGKAMDLLKQAIALQNAQGAPQAFASSAATPSAAEPANPFTGLPGQREHSTLQADTTLYPTSVPVQDDPRSDVAIAPVGTAPAAYAGRRTASAAPAPVNASTITYPPSPVSQSPEPLAPLPAPLAARSSAPLPAAVPAQDAPPLPDRPSARSASVAAPRSTQTVPPTGYTPYTPPVAQAQPADLRGGARSAPAGSQASAPTSYATELDEIMQERSPEFRLGAQIRTRNGESGTSKLTDVETPMEIAFPVGDDRVTLRATPVSLNAGSVGSDYYSSSTFGGGPAAALNQIDGLTQGPASQRARGVGLSVVYATRGLTADAGVTPIGFVYKTFTGGIKFDGLLDNANTLSYTLNISRRPVTDSVLSFAGTRDRRTGQTFGGVSATGARLQLVKDYTDYGFYGAGSAYDLSGHNVASNSRFEVTGGMYYHLIRNSNSLLTTGLNATGVFYDKNLRYFTYGHGGYFSPQQYYALNVPLSWSQRGDRFTYQLKGSVGLQHFKEDDANYYPGNTNLQSLADIASASAVGRGLAGSSRAVYPGQSKTGVGYSLGAAGEYRVAPQLFFGGSFAMDNASDYRQLAGGIYMRYTFYPQSGLMALPVSPYRSPYGE